MGVVVVWGEPGDAPFDAVCGELARRDAAMIVLEQRRAPAASIDWSVASDVEGRLAIDDRIVELADVSAIYVRPYDLARVADRAGFGSDSAERRHAFALHHALYAWVDIADALVVNRPSAMASNGSKPYQAELIRAHGFAIPETLVTTDAEAARGFCARHGAVVYKSTSGVRSIVARVTAEALARLDDVAWCPTQFQAQVAGRDHRVHVIGDDVYACEIICDADDYRYAGRSGAAAEIRPVELPEEIAGRCVALARGLGLVIAGVDLRRTPDGVWYCFEVNPSPGFTYYEEQTGQPLAAAVADTLIRGMHEPVFANADGTAPRPPHRLVR